MLYRGLVGLLLGVLSWGQAANPKPATPPQTPVTPSGAPAAQTAPQKPNLPPDAPVITLKGICDSSSASAKAPANADCKTVITRAQFEALLGAIQPGVVAPLQRKQFADRYATALIMAHEAHKMGLDTSPRFEELMQLARVQVLSQELGRSLQDKAAQVSDKDIDDYYHNNAATYEETLLQRFFIPRSKQSEPSDEKLSEADAKKRQEAAEAAMKSEAEELHKRAVAGEDFTKLQAEAFQFAGLKINPPSISVGKVRRNSLPAAHASAFELKPGEVSQLIPDPTGYFVYKAGEKGTQPLDRVKEEIRNALRAKRMQEAMHAIQQSATSELDPNYFAGAGPQEQESESESKPKSKPPGSSKKPAKPVPPGPK